jgi:hypothetical protein
MGNWKDKTRTRSENNVEIDLEKKTWLCIFGFHKSREFLHQTSNYDLLKSDYMPRKWS